MRITWYNGAQLMGTQDVEVRYVAANEIRDFCGNAVFGCHDFIGETATITLIDSDEHGDLFPTFDQNETLFHEFMHAFCDNDEHNPPLVARNQETGGVEVRTKPVSNFYHDMKYMAANGRIVLTVLNNKEQ